MDILKTNVQDPTGMHCWNSTPQHLLPLLPAHF